MGGADRFPLFRTALKENRETLWLALPMAAGQVAQMLMGWADTVMVGRLGVLPLAACAFGVMVVHVFLVFGFGLISSVAIRASQEFGAGRGKGVGRVLLSGIVLAVVAGLAMALLVQAAWPLLYHLGQEREVVDEAKPFLLLLAWSMIPALLATVAKDFSEALSRPWLPFWIILGGVGLNVFFNWLLIYGNWGAPRLGLTGAGYGTLAARWTVALALFGVIFGSRSYAPYRVLRVRWRLLWSGFFLLVRLGWPSGVHLLGEVGLFAATTLMMGWIGVVALAAHQVAITLASTTFMLPLGLAFAVTVRVGQAVGAEESHRVRPIAFGALGFTVALMSLFSVIFLTCGHWIASWFITDPAVIATATMLLAIAGIFQLFDGFQIVGMGGLRGLADVRVPMFFVYIAYWCVALPVGYWLAFHRGWGAEGLWTGMAIGLAGTAFAVGTRLWIMSGRVPPRLRA
ncbi:MAG TPA: MATE family efflux transporter [Chthoniobacteraceae bacterium]|nr:MATE family efflux transporter [Chthoniobacteraceae bacterium]